MIFKNGDINIVKFLGISASFKSKLKVTRKTSADVPLKCLTNFQRTLEITLFNQEINLVPAQSSTSYQFNS